MLLHYFPQYVFPSRTQRGSVSFAHAGLELRLPATRFGKRAAAQKNASLEGSDKAPRKTELFPRSERAVDPTKALQKIRKMMELVRMGETELLSILRESGCQEAMFATSLSVIPDKVLGRCIERWETIQELAELARQDGGEAA
jgi:hypothetical protein